jgi:hypothetical protein
MNYIRLHEPVSFLSARAKSYAKILNQLIAIKERLAEENQESAQLGSICRAIITTKQKLRAELQMIESEILSHFENETQSEVINIDHLRFFVRSVLNIEKNIPEPFPLEIDTVESYLKSLSTENLTRSAFALQPEIRLSRASLEMMSELINRVLAVNQVTHIDNVVEWRGYPRENRMQA